MPALAVALLLAAFQGPTDFVVGEKYAYVMMPPRYVCGGEAGNLLWNPDGKRLAAIRMATEVSPKEIERAITGKAFAVEAKQSVEIHVWNTVSAASKRVISVDPNLTRIEDLQWLAGSSNLLLQTASLNEDGSTRQKALTSVNVDSGAIKQLGNYDAQAILQLSVSPSKPIGIVSFLPTHVPTITPGAPSPSIEFRFVSAGPTLSRPYQLPWGMNQYWSDDGTRPLFFHHRLVGGKAEETWSHFDPGTGTLQPATAPSMEPVMPEIIVRTARVDNTLTREGESLPVLLLKPRIGNKADTHDAVLTSDGTEAALAPDLSAVAYVHRGTVLVRQLVKLPKQAFLEAREAAKKAEAISNARQTGLALLMYSADYDDTFPMNNAQWQENVQPYIKNQSITKDFVLTFPGGMLPPGADPSQTEMGFMPGPGGRAVVYADGHVVWVPDAW